MKRALHSTEINNYNLICFSLKKAFWTIQFYTFYEKSRSVGSFPTLIKQADYKNCEQCSKNSIIYTTKMALNSTDINNSIINFISNLYLKNSV